MKIPVFEPGDLATLTGINPDGLTMTTVVVARTVPREETGNAPCLPILPQKSAETSEHKKPHSYRRVAGVAWRLLTVAKLPMFSAVMLCPSI
jgi:hypothetical protein